MKGVLVCNTCSREICLVIKMLQIVFRSLRRLSILCVGNHVPYSVWYWSEEENKGGFTEKIEHRFLFWGGGVRCVSLLIASKLPAMAFVEANSLTGHVLVHASIRYITFVWISLLKEKRVYISQSVHVVLNMQAPSEYRRMNNLSCHNPTGNVLGIYILSSRALGEPSQQSWYTLSPRPFAQQKTKSFPLRGYICQHSETTKGWRTC